MSRGRCDLCGAELRHLSSAVYVRGEEPAWTICMECALLVDAGELLPLARRVAAHLMAWRFTRDHLRPAWTASILADVAAAIEEVFWGARAVAPHPWAGIFTGDAHRDTL